MSDGGDDEGASEGASLWLTSFRLVAFGWGRGVLGLRIPGAPPGRRPGTDGSTYAGLGAAPSQPASGI